MISPCNGLWAVIFHVQEVHVKQNKRIVAPMIKNRKLLNKVKPIPLKKIKWQVLSP